MAVQTQLHNTSPIEQSRAQKQKIVRIDAKPSTSNRHLVRGVLELARLHTKESWLCWYPAVWGACLSAGSNDANLDLAQFAKILISNVVCVTATHCTFCTFNDICDRNLDQFVERCKVRPLPAGLISVTGAIIAFVAWSTGTLFLTYATLGTNGLITFAPIWLLSMIYPFMKRVIPFPQVVLGIVIGCAVFPGWVSVSNNLDHLTEAAPIFLATAAWVIFFDVFYATQDRADDRKIGVKSLAVLLGDDVPVFLGYLGAIQLALFSLTAFRANMSALFWVLGIGAWTLNVPYHILALNVNDPKSGGRIFKANIMLGLYFTMIAIAELMVTRVLGWDNLKYMQLFQGVSSRIGLAR